VVTQYADWAPFDSLLAFKTADFFYRVDKASATKIDYMLELWAESLAEFGGKPPFKSHKDLYSTIDAIPTSVPWKSHKFTYEGQKPPNGNAPKWMTGEYEIFYRDPRRLFMDMLENPEFVKDIDYAPLRQYNKNGSRQYENFMSGDWAWKQAVSHLSFSLFNSVVDKQVIFRMKSERSIKTKVPYLSR
jgi:hypothetical protein